MEFRNTAAWKTVKWLAVDPARRAFAKIANPAQIPLDWCAGSNWGDALNPFLVELLSGQKVVHLTGLHHDRFMVIGSILDGANERTEVWGSGFIREDGSTLRIPRKIHAVRGPLSRALLLKQGAVCPEVYGDPALLIQYFFNPPIKKTYSVGIIPHYIDKGNEALDRYRNDPEVLIIDIESDIKRFICAVKSCDIILSSSLHGLICADAYGVPNVWIQLSENVVGGDFKFRDYRLSIGGGEPKATRLPENGTLSFATMNAKHREPDLDLRRLLLACPFLSDDLRRQVSFSRFMPERLTTLKL